MWLAMEVVYGTDSGTDMEEGDNQVMDVSEVEDGDGGASSEGKL